LRITRLAPARVTLAAALREQMLTEAKQHAPRETGGVLLGVRDTAESHVRVTELVGAGPSAKRERFRFVPDGPWQRRQIAGRYLASGRTLEYIGDWHSHPHGNGPSRLDRATARKIARTASARCAHPIFVIAACIDGSWELRAYRFTRRRFRRVRLITD
jgi:integrative and conjugative element protein (TIGR02256 family)